MQRNNTSFPIQITNKLKELYSDYEKDNKWNKLLHYYQYIVKNIITNPNYKITDSRGLLLYFTMGMGKTRTAASIALTVNMPVVIILPKSLQSNFADTISHMELNTGLTFKNKLKYVSSDAYNAASQLDQNIDNSLIIIDEAHNFFKAIINGMQTSNAYKIYEKIMYAKNIKLLLLTGTPISKNPFELVPCINLLHGSDVLPSQYDQFNNLYLDTTENNIKNKAYLANRILGLVSYMTLSESSKQMFPNELPLIVSKVEMSTKQYRKYLQVREKEEANKKREYVKYEKILPAMSLPRQISMSSYYILSRSVSNFVYPIENEPITDDNGPKLALISQRVFDVHGLAMVYSQFVNSHGLVQLTYYLKNKGFVEFKENSDKSEALRFALYTGDVSAKARDKILKTFNSKENMYGSYLKVLLVSKTGAEGLDLKNVRETHQMEPYWDLSRDKQVKSRAIRYGSHLDLPESERTVQPYLYISVPNKKMWDSLSDREDKTIDEIFHERAVKQDQINTKFNELLKEVSIECSYFGFNNCYVCNPSNETLFNADPMLDIKMTNPCITYEETEKDAIQIIIDDTEYYYTEGIGHVYKFNPSLNGYIEVKDYSLIQKIKDSINSKKDNE